MLTFFAEYKNGDMWVDGMSYLRNGDTFRMLPIPHQLDADRNTECLCNEVLGLDPIAHYDLGPPLLIYALDESLCEQAKCKLKKQGFSVRGGMLYYSVIQEYASSLSQNQRMLAAAVINELEDMFQSRFKLFGLTSSDFEKFRILFWESK